MSGAMVVLGVAMLTTLVIGAIWAGRRWPDTEGITNTVAIFLAAFVVPPLLLVFEAVR